MRKFRETTDSKGETKIEVFEEIPAKDASERVIITNNFSSIKSQLESEKNHLLKIIIESQSKLDIVNAELLELNKLNKLDKIEEEKI